MGTGSPDSSERKQNPWHTLLVESTFTLGAAMEFFPPGLWSGYCYVIAPSGMHLLYLIAKVSPKEQVKSPDPCKTDICDLKVKKKNIHN